MGLKTEHGEFTVSDNMVNVMGWVALILLFTTIGIVLSERNSRHHETGQTCIEQGHDWVDGDCFTTLPDPELEGTDA